MTHKSENVKANDLDAKLAEVDANNGQVVAVLPHPFLTDGDGAMLIIVWRE